MKNKLPWTLALPAMIIAIVSIPVFVAAFATDSGADSVDMKGVVARVGSGEVTSAQLTSHDEAELQNAQSKLLHARYDLYVAQRNALNKAIDDELLAQEARKEQVTVDQLLKRHVESQIKEPSEETLQIYYMGTQKPEPYATARDKIRAYIHQLQQKKLQSDYVAKLRAGETVRVMLEPPRLNVGPGDNPPGGEEAASVTLVEFADYQCPYCRKAEPELQRLREEFKGKLRYAFRDFPLPMHEYAEKAAEGARCAGRQGAFWQMHERMFQGDGENLGVPQIKVIAQQLKLNTDQFDHCLDSGATAAAVQKDMNEGKQLGLSGTPSFFVNGYFLSGAVSYDMIQDLVAQQLQLQSSHSHVAADSSKSTAICAHGRDERAHLARADICELPSAPSRRGSGS